MRIGVALVLAVLLGGCSGSDAGSPGFGPHAHGGDASVDCIDRDGDGYGDGCAEGSDCDDRDPAVQSGCKRCALPNDGCACAEGSQPVACYLDKSTAEDGIVMCHEGTRYCRDGIWSGCEGVHSYPLPDQGTSSTSLIVNDGGPIRCNDCNVACFRITDTLDPIDGGLDDNGEGVGWHSGGGLTLGTVPDAGMPDAGMEPPMMPVCTPGVGDDPDCDGVPNQFDPYPNERPFATANPTIFLDIPPGGVGTGAIDLDFFINSADVYFLVDQSGSMADERDRLKADLTMGDFIQDATFDCADYDFDFQPNNELKAQGIVGAIRCIIRDTYFGVGLFREIPFYPYVNDSQWDDHVAFANYHDISGNVNSVLAAINRLQTISNRDWPEASMVALHTLLTGNSMYFGTTRRGIPPREDCSSLTWGYPCFRQGAIPIVVMFTDAQFHNGPDNNDFRYNSDYLSITAGTNGRYYPLPATNETFGDPANLGDLTSSYKTFTGDTAAMRADLGSAAFSCLSNSDAPDAVFQFSLTQQRSVKIESTGSQFDTVLGLYAGLPATPTTLTASTNTNEVASSAYDFDNVYNKYVVLPGSTATMAADYQWSDVGCASAGASPDAVFKFKLSQATRLAIDASGSAFDTVLALYSAAPALPPTYTGITNTNEGYLTAHSALDVYNQTKAFSGNTGSMAVDYSAAQIGCNADNGANDAVYSFNLTQPTKVRLSTEGSSYDTVIGLFDNSANPIGNTAVSPTNEIQSSAYNAGTLNGRIFKLTGSTGSMKADIGRTPIGCNSNDYAPDAVFKFSLDLPADVQIDTTGTSWDTVLSLHNSLIDAYTTYVNATNTNEKLSSAQHLGVLNSKEYRLIGASTSSMDADFSASTEATCSSSDSARDAAYSFTLDTDTLVRIDLAGSSFDTTVSLHAAPPADSVSAVPANTNEAYASALDVGPVNGMSFQKTGSTGSMGHDYNVGCTSDSAAKDAVYKFTLSSSTSVQIDTEGSTFDTVLGLYPSTIVAEPDLIDVGTGGSLQAAPNEVGTINNTWRKYKGTTLGAGADWGDSRCSSDGNAEDVYYRFTVTGSASSTRNLSISTSNSSYDTVLIVYKRNSANTSWNYYDCKQDSDATETFTDNFSPGTYLVVVKGDRSYDEGAYELSIKDNSVASSNQLTCDDDGGAIATSSKITRTLSAGTYYVVVSGGSAAASGNYTLRFRDATWWNSYGQIECDDDDGAGNSSLIERQLTAGKYYVIVKGYSYWQSGAYQLRVTDVNPPPEAIPAITCDDDSGGSSQARIVRSGANRLPAGDYWVVLKGDEDYSSGSYTVNIKDINASASGAIIECDDDSGDAGSSVIERNLTAGTYQVIVKGDGPSDEGAYQLSMRDVTNRPYNRITCDDDTGADSASYIEQNLAAGTYYVVLKGAASDQKGAYNLSLRDVTNRPLSSTHCDDNGSTNSTSKIEKTLNAGTYYVALKGKNGTAKGPYQLSIGAGATYSTRYVPPTWSDTLSAIRSSGAHVIPILSCHDDPNYGDDDGDCKQARAQAITLANASDALGENLQPLVFDIDGDGTGLSRTVVNALAELSNYLEMDVQVRVVFDPNPNPGFIVRVHAIDQVGDGCSGLIGVEHQNCVPGASPRFTIEFENPLAAPVPLHPTDPHGGYHFRAELIGDDQFIIDAIPIYIIPEDVVGDMGPEPPEYYEEGQYWQDATSQGCTGNRAPDWRDLSWNADVYRNTTVSFSACTGLVPEELQTCTPHVIASVTGGEDCTTSADCDVGYCDTDIGVCQIARAGTCATNEDCAINAFCDPAVHMCTFTGQPVYIGAPLGGDNFKPHIRMVIDLSATLPFDDPPVVHGWEMTYLCNNVL